MKKKLHTTKIVAQYLDLSERRVRQLRDEGVLEEKAPGLYDLRSSVRRYINYLRGDEGGKAEGAVGQRPAALIFGGVDCAERRSRSAAPAGRQKEKA